jgi:uroporphyrinogen-III decarboxylase
VWKREIDGLEGIVIENPLADWSKFDGYKAPDPMTQGDRGAADWESTRKNIAEARKAGRLTSGGTVHGFLFMRLFYIRGFENLMLDMATDEPRLRKLIDLIVDHTLKVVNEYLAMGVDVMGFADDLGTQTASMISPQTFHKWITPAYKRVVQPCRKAGCHVSLHSDGHMIELTEELIEAGVTITNPQDLCNGIDEIAKAMKGRVCIRLDIDRQDIVPHGTRKEIHDLIEEEVLKLGSPRGGLEFIAGIYPPTPAENIDALCCALEEFRTYWSDGRGT